MNYLIRDIDSNLWNEFKSILGSYRNIRGVLIALIKEIINGNIKIVSTYGGVKINYSGKLKKDQHYYNR